MAKAKAKQEERTLVDVNDENTESVTACARVTDADILEALDAEMARQTDRFDRAVVEVTRDAFALAHAYESGKTTRGETVEALRRLRATLDDVLAREG